MGIDLGVERVPDSTTLAKFRRLIEDKDLGTELLAKIGEVLQAQGLKVGAGTIVDATIIAVPSSTENARGARDSEMHQIRKGKHHHGLAKNATRAFVALGLANIYLARQRLLA